MYTAALDPFNYPIKGKCKFPYQFLINLTLSISIRRIFEVLKQRLKIEPTFSPMTREAFDYQTENTSSKPRVDIRARGFWERLQEEFFDERVFDLNASIFDPNASRYLKTASPQCFIQNKKEKVKLQQ